MDELVQLVSQKTGLSEEMSRQAVEVVLEYLKEKLPEPIAGQLDNVLEGSKDLIWAISLQRVWEAFLAARA
jgi:uncharacterized protein (DUF2267 family)